MGLGFVIFMEFIPVPDQNGGLMCIHMILYIHTIYIFIHIYIHIYIYIHIRLYFQDEFHGIHKSKKQLGIFW